MFETLNAFTDKWTKEAQGIFNLSAKVCLCKFIRSTIFMLEKPKQISISQILEINFICFVYMSEF